MDRGEYSSPSMLGASHIMSCDEKEMLDRNAKTGVATPSRSLHKFSFLDQVENRTFGKVVLSVTIQGQLLYQRLRQDQCSFLSYDSMRIWSPGLIRQFYRVGTQAHSVSLWHSWVLPSSARSKMVHQKMAEE